MRKQIEIPKTLTGATKAIERIEAQIQAKEWERAAIVVAFTADQQGSRHDLGFGKVPGRLGIEEFARLGMTTLASPTAVKRRRQFWQRAGGSLYIGPGDLVDLPTEVFPIRRPQLVRETKR